MDSFYSQSLENAHKRRNLENKVLRKENMQKKEN